MNRLMLILTLAAPPVLHLDREINTPPARGERIKDRLAAGDVAPDFSLPLLKGGGEVALSSFRGKRPVVLIFASYT